MTSPACAQVLRRVMFHFTCSSWEGVNRKNVLLGFNLDSSVKGKLLLPLEPGLKNLALLHSSFHRVFKIVSDHNLSLRWTVFALLPETPKLSLATHFSGTLSPMLLMVKSICKGHIRGDSVPASVKSVLHSLQMGQSINMDSRDTD